LFGLSLTAAVIAPIYWCFPDFSDPYWESLDDGQPFDGSPVMAASLIYFAVADRWLAAPKDGFWHAGMGVFGACCSCG
jgi:hypothetical protein